MADSGVSARLCKYCSKGVDSSNPKNWKCAKCGSLFHHACAQRVKSLKVVSDQENLVQCCDSEIAGKFNVVPHDSNKAEDEGRTEIMYLKMLLQEKDARIQELCKLNQLLEEKISLKCEQVNQLISARSSKKEKDGNTSNLKINNSVSLSEGKHPPNNDKAKADKVPEKSSDSGQPVISYAEKLVNKQRHVMNKIVNLVSHSSDVVDNLEAGDFSESEGFTEVEPRRRNGRGKPNNKLKDQAETTTYKRQQVFAKGSASVAADDAFKAKPSKMWLYIGRAVHTVTEQIVEDYITKGCNIVDKSELEIKGLPFVGKSRAFQVGIDPSYYEKVNCGEFWPKGIVIRRFYFGSKRTNNADFEEHRHAENEGTFL